MPYLTRQLGKNGPQVTALGFGCMSLSLPHHPSDEDRLKLLTHLYESGERFWDSANIYGDNEEILGRWFRENPDKRQDVVLSTKFGLRGMNEPPRSDAPYVLESFEKSIKRLGVDYIDLYYVHRVDSAVPIEETVGAMKKLVESGKVKYLGLSEVSAATIRRAHAVHPITAVQMEYSPFSLEPDKPEFAVLQTCKELGIAMIAYSPLGRGILTGQIRTLDDLPKDDARHMWPRFSPENFEKNLVLADALQDIADKKGCTIAQLTLAWLMKQGDMVIPIPGTKSLKYFEENMGALDVKLSEQEVKEIRRLCEEADVQGARYPDAFLAALFADTVPARS